MERTKSRHFGAFGDSYPKVSPFSANKQTVKELKLPHMPKGNSRLTQSHDTPLLDSDEKYRHTYSFLLKKLQASKDSAEVTRKLPGGGKGVWRHIKQSYGTGPNLLSWVDGCRSLEDNGMMPLEPGMVPGQRPKECGGKGPNKHIVDSYGAGPNVIAWVSDANTQQTEREGSFHRVLPSLRPLKPFCAWSRESVFYLPPLANHLPTRKRTLQSFTWRTISDITCQSSARLIEIEGRNVNLRPPGNLGFKVKIWHTCDRHPYKFFAPTFTTKSAYHRHLMGTCDTALPKSVVFTLLGLKIYVNISWSAHVLYWPSLPFIEHYRPFTWLTRIIFIYLDGWTLPNLYFWLLHYTRHAEKPVKQVWKTNAVLSFCSY